MSEKLSLDNEDNDDQKLGLELERYLIAKLFTFYFDDLHTRYCIDLRNKFCAKCFFCTFQLNLRLVLLDRSAENSKRWKTSLCSLLTLFVLFSVFSSFLTIHPEFNFHPKDKHRKVLEKFTFSLCASSWPCVTWLYFFSIHSRSQLRSGDPKENKMGMFLCDAVEKKERGKRRKARKKQSQTRRMKSFSLALEHLR